MLLSHVSIHFFQKYFVIGYTCLETPTSQKSFEQGIQFRTPIRSTYGSCVNKENDMCSLIGQVQQAAEAVIFL